MPPSWQCCPSAPVLCTPRLLHSRPRRPPVRVLRLISRHGTRRRYSSRTRSPGDLCQLIRANYGRVINDISSGGRGFLYVQSQLKSASDGRLICTTEPILREISRFTLLGRFSTKHLPSGLRSRAPFPSTAAPARRGTTGACRFVEAHSILRDAEPQTAEPWLRLRSILCRTSNACPSSAAPIVDDMVHYGLGCR